MVARITRLRLALLASAFFGSAGAVTARLLGRFIGLALPVGVAYVPVMLADDDTALLADLDVVVTSGVLLVFLLVAFFAPQRVLNPRLFAQYPARSWNIGLSLLLTSPLTWTGLGAIVWGVAFLVFRTSLDWVSPPWWVFLMLAIVLAVGTRLCAHVTALLVESRAARATQRIAGAVLAVSFAPPVLYFAITMTPDQSRQTLRESARILTWSPPGALVGYLYGASSGLAPVWVVLVVLLSIALVLVANHALVTSVDRPVAGTIMRLPTGWFDLLPLGQTMAVAARSLTYWVRDPRYRVSLTAIPVIPVLVLAVMLVAGLTTETLVVILLPLTFMLFGWMIHNDVASDSSAIWIHLASGVRGWQDRVGRIVPVFIFGIPLLLLSSSIAVMILDDWRVLPGILGLGLVALSAGASVSSVMSAAAPYPTTRPHESPFVQPLWYRSGAGIAQTVSMIVSAAVTLPAFLVVEHMIREPFVSEQFALLGLAAGYAFVLLVIGVTLGGFIFNRRGSEILAFTLMFD